MVLYFWPLITYYGMVWWARICIHVKYTSSTLLLCGVLCNVGLGMLRKLFLTATVCVRVCGGGCGWVDACACMSFLVMGKYVAPNYKVFTMGRWNTYYPLCLCVWYLNLIPSPSHLHTHTSPLFLFSFLPSFPSLKHYFFL